MNGDWKKAKRGFDFFLDFDNLQEIIDNMMRDIFNEDAAFQPSKPLVMGFNIRMSEDGRPIINRFGNFKAEGSKPMVSDAREPLIDVVESEKDITITAELPGVEKKGIKFSLPTKNTAVVDVRGERIFFKEIKLPAAIKQKGAKAKFKNGILEVLLEKEKLDNAEKTKDEVKIE